MYSRCLTTVLSALLAFSAWEMPTLCGGGDALARTQDPQGRLVKGTVTSNDGEPLAGAFVYVKNSKLGVNTDLDGHYEIAAPVEGKKLCACLPVSWYDHQRVYGLRAEDLECQPYGRFKP